MRFYPAAVVLWSARRWRLGTYGTMAPETPAVFVRLARPGPLWRGCLRSQQRHCLTSNYTSIGHLQNKFFLVRISDSSFWGRSAMLPSTWGRVRARSWYDLMTGSVNLDEGHHSAHWNTCAFPISFQSFPMSGFASTFMWAALADHRRERFTRLVPCRPNLSSNRVNRATVAHKSPLQVSAPCRSLRVDHWPSTDQTAMDQRWQRWPHHNPPLWWKLWDLGWKRRQGLKRPLTGQAMCHDLWHLWSCYIIYI